MLPNHLGDVVMATPALRALRRTFPKSRITGLVRRELAGVLEGAPWLDALERHAVYTVRGARRLGRRWRLARSLLGTDLVVVLPNSFSSALVARWTGAAVRLGYARRGRTPLLTHPVDPPRCNGRFHPVAMERYYLDLVARLGCDGEETRLELRLDAEGERACEARFSEHALSTERPLVCLAPGAAYGPSKLWPLPYFAEVATELLADGAQVALVHAPGEESLAAEILARTPPGLVSLGGPGMTLSLLKSVVARAQLLICNDAGARHVAAAFGAPALVLMGPTSPAYTNLNLARTKLLRQAVPCSPCQRKVCPIDHRCMTGLEPRRVLDEARAVLEDPDWQGDVGLELRA